MKRQINKVARAARQAAKSSHEKIVDSSDKVISQVDRVKGTLPDLNLKRVELVVRAIVIGKLNAAIPLALKDLPAVAKSLASRAGSVAPDKLFNQIPGGVRLTEESIMAFLNEHDVSHRISRKNNPTKAGDINNVIFETRSANRARGSKNMSRAEFKKAQSHLRIEGIKHGIKNTVGPVTKGMLLGALLEFPVTVIENTLHVKNNRKSQKDAYKDAAKDIGKSAGFAGVTTAAFTGLSLLGVTLGAATIPLAIVGGVMYTWSATDRIWKALDDKTKERLINSEAVLFLASVTRCADNQDYISSIKISSIKMLPEKYNIDLP